MFFSKRYSNDMATIFSGWRVGVMIVQAKGDFLFSKHVQKMLELVDNKSLLAISDTI